MSAPTDHIDYGEQPPLAGLGPQPGDTYRNIHMGTICTIVRVEQSRRAWYVIRHRGDELRTSPKGLAEHWEPCRPDGTPKQDDGQ